MPQIETMTLDEKLAISNKACALEQAGDKEVFSRLIRAVPILPYLAKIMEKKMRANFLINGGCILSGTEAELGPNRLSA